MTRSRLGKYRRPKFGVLTKQYNTKLPDDLADDLEQVCRDLNMTPPEFIRFLIYEEVQELKKGKIPEDTGRYQKVLEDTSKYLSVSSTIKTPERIQKPRRSAPGGRFTTKEWQVGGKTACPVCETWQSSSNFARHAQSAHNMTPQEIFSKEENREKARKMVAEATNKPEL